ncbi:hypothetical protein Y032_0025g1174 [Ancylostoma ceylanicum]|uniref:Uncharacterized protein n=1 Tax=Ancylostoma ceylanicum TaxID=53326 RepID=A0A016UWI1_9BILA|nr:hypothetical protein Y032_0025g1174 [Ancylostoma ceylanicum]
MQKGNDAAEDKEEEEEEEDEDEDDDEELDEDVDESDDEVESWRRFRSERWGVVVGVSDYDVGHVGCRVVRC